MGWMKLVGLLRRFIFGRTDVSKRFSLNLHKFDIGIATLDKDDCLPKVTLTTAR
jgi:hypothetical protein